MKNLVIGLVALVFAIGGIYLFGRNRQPTSPFSLSPTQRPNQDVINDEPVEIIAQGLDTPWAIAFLPDGSFLVTERRGSVRRVDKDRNLSPNFVVNIGSVKEIGEGGLMGIALHPDFETNNYVYLYYTYSGSGNNTLNRVVRMKYENEALNNEEIIVDQIPGAANHNGGRIYFGPDNNLYITTGDAQEPSRAQDKNSLAGKILRVTDDGKPVNGNPFNNLVFSYGHRNPQGIAWDNNGSLWSTEHGPSGLQSGNDEINKIEVGKNYGWPTIQGDQIKVGMETPIKHSGTSDTWAPAGVVIINNSLFFGGLRGQALYEAMVENGKITEFREHFKGQLGRIREVTKDSAGMIYITTSNRDGRGSPRQGDDKIIRINPRLL